MGKGESAKLPVLPFMVTLDEFGFADLEPNVAEHGGDSTGHDLHQLYQPAFHDRSPSEFLQEPDVGHRHLEQVQRGIGEDDCEASSY